MSTAPQPSRRSNETRAWPALYVNPSAWAIVSSQSLTSAQCPPQRTHVLNAHTHRLTRLLHHANHTKPPSPHAHTCTHPVPPLPRLPARPRQARPDAVIVKRREMEDKRAELFANIADAERVGQYADFERNTQARIDQNRAMEHFRRLKREASAHLQSRRGELARMLESERRQYEADMAASFETIAQRKVRLMERARKLKAEREAARQIVLKDCRDRQFRAACDDVRNIQGEKALREACQGRVHQIRQKEESKVAQAAVDRDWATSWEGMRLARIERENEEKAFRDMKDEEMKA